MTTKKKRAKSGERFGFLDETGAVAIDPRFLDVRDFSAGGAWVQTEAGWGRIDAAGTWVCEPRFAEIGKASHGLRRVLLDGRHQWVGEGDGVVRFDGFLAALCAARTLDAEGRYWGNRGGHTDPRTRMTKGGVWQLYRADHEAASPPLAEGWAPFFVGNGLCVTNDSVAGGWQLRDLDTTPIGPKRTGANLGFSGGRMVFHGPDGYGAYDLDGGVAISAGFPFLSPFDDAGRAVAWLGGDRVAVVDRSGNTLTEATLESIGDRSCACIEGFIDGYAKVELRGGSNYHAKRANLLCPDGSWVFGTWHYDVDVPVEGQCKVKPGQHTANVAGLDGALLFGEELAFIDRHSGLGFVVKKRGTDGLVALYSFSGELLLDFEVQSLGPFAGTDLVHVIQRDKHGLRRTDGSWLMPCEARNLRPRGDLIAVAAGGELKHRYRGRKGPVDMKGASWRLLDFNLQVRADLGKLPWGIGPLSEGRMSFAQRVKLG